jgi:hypothetical protein
MAQSHPNLGRLEPFYGTYMQVMPQFKEPKYQKEYDIIH